MKGFNKWYLIILFGAILLAPMLNDIFHVTTFKRADESRDFHDSLSISISKLDQFPKDCEAYLNDNFAFRTPMIEYNAAIKYHLLHVSPNPERLILGKNGRLFVAESELYIYEGRFLFNEKQLDGMVSNWKKRMAYFEQRNIVPYLVVGPTALEVYSEDLPSTIQKRSQETILGQMSGRFEKEFPDLFIDLRPVLKQKKAHNLYFKLDPHWNNRAGIAVTEEVLKRLKKEHFPALDLSYLSRYTWTIDYVKTGHLRKLLPQNNIKEAIPIATIQDGAEAADKFGFEMPANFLYPDYFELHFVNKKSPNKYKLLIIRDSFGDAVFPFLKDGFAETLVIWDNWEYRLNENIIETYKPDVVIYITYDRMLERYIEPKVK